MIIELYRKVLPYSLRKRIYDLFLAKVLFFFRNFPIISRSFGVYLLKSFLEDNKFNRAYAFMGRYGNTAYPGEYFLKYKNLQVQVEYDEMLKLPYVYHHENRLYFPSFFSPEKTAKEYKALLIEQDPEAAHRYVISYDELKGRTLLDIGSAEGIFALDTIHFVDHVYLFEYEDFWIEPLKATFAPWSDKVTIIKKYVGDKTSGIHITIDDFLKPMNIKHLFIKMDIEGGERLALAGATDTLQSNNDIAAAVCTYHRDGDPEFMKNLFEKYGFSCLFSEGVMCWNKRLSIGLIRCKKQSANE